MEDSKQKIKEIWKNFIKTIADLTKRRRELLHKADEEWKEKEIEKIKNKLEI